MTSSRAATVASLRAALGAPRSAAGRLPCGHAGLDAWLGGWPVPGVVEIAGAPGSGRLALVLPALGALLRQGRPVAVIDPWQVFHPPACGDLPLASLVLVRPSPEQVGWTTEQVARSGAVAATLVLDPPPLGRAGVRVARAAEAGRMLVWLVGGAAEPDVPAVLRLHTEGWEGATLRVRCTKGPGRVEGVRSIAPGAAPAG